MTDEPDIPKKVRALFALRKLSEQLQTDVLSSPGAAKRWEIDIQRTTALVPGSSVTWETLFSVFRSAADGVAIPPLLDTKGNDLNAVVSIDAEGAALVAFGQHRLRFSHAILMASDTTRRVAALEEIFKTVTLTHRDRDELRQLLSAQYYSVEEFLRVSEIISSSPEEFAMRLGEKVRGGKIPLSDVLPQSLAHWEALTAPLAGSTTLADFIDNELAHERASRVDLAPGAAVRSMALTFSAPALVPYGLPSHLSVNTKIELLQEAARLSDHFSLAGAFELCASWAEHDPRFVPVGDLLLDALFSNMKRLGVACGMFASAFVLAFAKLAEDEHTKEQPAFWRRLAAASHAQLIVRACGITEIDHSDLLQGAINQSGEAYFAALLLDFATDPQWRPEWIDNKFLVADVCGRAINALARLSSDKAPDSWKTRIDQVKSYVDEQHLGLLTMFPAVTEGARRSTELVLAERQDLVEPYQPFMDKPTVENLLLLTPLVDIFGFPREALDRLHKVTSDIRSMPLGDDDTEQGLLNALKLMAHISAMLQDAPLADAVSATCIERLAVTTKRPHALELIYRLIECAAADRDRTRALTSLVQRLEQASLVMAAAALIAEFGGILQTLKEINPSLESRLGRAMATAKLAASSIRAA
jgi:hypothetical protein